MLNEDKIKLMTGIAMYEKREDKYIFPANHYFKGDYISSHMFRSFFAFTLCYILGVLIWGLYHMEELLNTIDLDEVLTIIKGGAMLYGVGLLLYLIITFLVYQKRYEIAKRGLKVYLAKLKRLEKRYEFQSRSKELTKEGSRRDGASRN